MTENIDNRIKKTLSNVFKVNINLIDETSSIHSLHGWDSINHIKMTLALEEEFSIKFTTYEIESMINFKIIKKTILIYI